MNLIGIIGAMEEEVSQLKEKMTEVRITKKAEMEFCKGILNGKAVVVVRSGIGKVNAGICAQILVDDYQVDCIINTGIAGSLKNEINIGDIVVSTDTVQHDMDATGFGYPLGQIPPDGHPGFPADEKLIALAQEVCREVIPEIQVFAGRVVSGDQFVVGPGIQGADQQKFPGILYGDGGSRHCPGSLSESCALRGSAGHLR